MTDHRGFVSKYFCNDVISILIAIVARDRTFSTMPQVRVTRERFRRGETKSKTILNLSKVAETFINARKRNNGRCSAADVE